MTAKKATAQPRRGPRYRGQGGPRHNKFGARRTPVDGIMFDSAKEAHRYQQLRLEERHGTIRELKLQVPFAIVTVRPNGEHVTVANYVSDFTYVRMYPDGDEEFIVEDSKGVRTRDFNLKKKLVEAYHGIEILLT